MKTCPSVSLLLCAVMILWHTESNAQWEAKGPGADAHCLAINGGGLFAGTWGAGIFLSTDNGASWASVNSGLTSCYVWSLAVSGTNLFAGTNGGGGVFLSTDNGTSWSAIGSGLANGTLVMSVRCLAVSGTSLLAGTDGAGIYRSTNNGESWTAVNAGLTNSWVTSFVVTTTGIFAGTLGGVFFSASNGASWSPTGLGPTDVQCLAVSGMNLLAGTSAGLFVSTNDGTSWTAFSSGLANMNVQCLVTSGTNLFAGTLSAGIFLSTDNGASWASVNSGLTNYYVRSLAVSGTSLYAGTGDGVYLSANKGSSWISVNSTPTFWYVYSFAASGGKLFAGTGRRGIFSSTNNGANWSSLNIGFSEATVFALTADGPCVYAGTWDHGMLVSTDNGANWSPASPLLNYPTIYSPAVSGTNLFAGTSLGIFLSTNNGTSWTSVSSGLTNIWVWSLAVSGTNLYAGTRGGGVFLSTNNGTNWTSVSSGITNMDVRCLIISGTNLFAGTYGGGVFRSTDNGTSWMSVNSGLTSKYINALAISGMDLFAGGDDGSGVFLSTNNGTSWIAVNTGLPNTPVFAIAVRGSYLFAGTGFGVWRRPLSEMTIQSPDVEFALKSIQITNLSPEDIGQCPTADTSYVSVLLNNNTSTALSNLPVTFSVNDTLVEQKAVTLTALSKNSPVVFAYHIPSRVSENLQLEIRLDPARTSGYLVPKDGLRDTVSIYYVSSNDQKLPFNMRRDAYHFSNYGTDRTDFENSWNETIMQSNLVGRIAGQFLGLLEDYLIETYTTGWHCYGMATTSSIYLSNPEIKPSLSISTWNLTIDQAKPNISKYQVSQAFDVLNKILIVRPLPLIEIFESAKDLIRSNIAPIVIMESDIHNCHAVTAYKIVERHNVKIVYIYDNNDPWSPLNLKFEKRNGALAILFDFTTSNPIADVYDAEWPYGALELEGSPYSFPRLYYFDTFDNSFPTLAGCVQPHLTPQSYSVDLAMTVVYEILYAMRDNLTALVACPTYPLFTDQMGRRTGFMQGKIVNEIPRATIDTALDVKMFKLPKGNTYSLTSTAYDSGKMSLDFIVPRSDSVVNYTEYRDLSISKGSTFRATLSDLTVAPSIIYNASTPGSRDSTIKPTTVNLVNVITGVKDRSELSQLPRSFVLYASYPNPFNPSTTIQYSLPKSTTVTLEIFNTLGQLVSTLVNGFKEAGLYQVYWNASNVPSGIYFYRLQAGEFVETKKMIFLH